MEAPKSRRTIRVRGDPISIPYDPATPHHRHDPAIAMNNFGVIEVASTKTTNAPGWAYVPDAGPAGLLAQQHAAATTNRKRARKSAANPTYADLSARQEAKTRKELEVLDRDNHRDVAIPVPPKSRSARNAKHTPSVRKILQSQKTFANHLDDWLALNPTDGVAAARKASAATVATPKPDTSAHALAGKPLQAKHGDVEMTDAPAAKAVATPGGDLLYEYKGPRAEPHPMDDNPLLVSRVPPMPSHEELHELLAAPPLTYLEARAGWTEEDQKYPVRMFCEACGYWGRVKCMKCGTRVCALDCLEAHREECMTRYGL